MLESMKPTPALFLLLVAVPALADVPPSPVGEIERVHDFARLDRDEAAQLHGQPAKFRIRLNSEADSEAGKVVYDCVDEDGIDRTVWFINGQQVEGDACEMIVEATFRFVRLAAWTAPDGMKFPAHTEYRLEDARRWR
jgi:hypothetical protein